MPLGFDPANAPFDRLTGTEVEAARAALDIGYFRPGEVILAEGAAPQDLHVVIKGQVEEREGADVVALLGPGDAFDGRALVQGGGGHGFVAAEETLCHLLPRAIVTKLIAENPRFAAFFHRDIARKLDAAADEADERAFGATMRARIGELHLHAAVFVDGDATLETAARTMSEAASNALFVRDGARVGIVSTTRLAEGVILRRLPLETPVRDVAQFAVVACARDDFVSTALMQMTKHKTRRVAVRDGDSYVGVLEDIDLLGFVAGGSQLAAMRIERARDLDDLARVSADIEGQTRTLRRQGVKIDVVCEIVSDLNRRLLARAFRLVAPSSIAERGCLIVMGSEGRAEQTVRTDQDNGLILAGPVPPADLEAFRAGFFAALERFGFPPCPGEVMARNPFWSKPAAEYLADVRGWTASLDEDAQMNVAILADAEAVAGDGALLGVVKRELFAGMRNEPARLAHFARAVDQFPIPIGLFNTLSPQDGEAIDLKKGGVFPIVHGVRALALERGVEETNTARRIEALSRIGALDAAFARELTQALFCLMTFRLDAKLGLGARGGRVVPGALSGMERDLLRDALRIVKQFRDLARRHFHLAMF